MKLTVDIQMVQENRHPDLKEIQTMTAIVNHAFATSEKGLWQQDSERTTIDEFTDFIKNGEIAAAKLNGQIVGCVHVRQVDKYTGGFGMLAVDSNYQGQGIASQLVYFAEQRFQKQQFSKIQLELLMPKRDEHPAKEMLKNWYEQIGYQRVSSESFEDSYAHLAQMLAIPCELVIFQKALTLDKF